MILIAIDPGTNCGWAVRSPQDVWDSGTWDLRPNRHEGGGMRFMRLRHYFRELITTVMPCAVYYEEVRRHMGTDAAHIYGGIIAVITEECESAVPKIPYRGIPVATIKKRATGKGNADKGQMIAAAKSRWPCHAFIDDNECDARWIAETAAVELGEVAA